MLESTKSAPALDVGGHLVDVTDWPAVQGRRPRSPEGTPVSREAIHATASALRATVEALGMQCG